MVFIVFKLCVYYFGSIDLAMLVLLKWQVFGLRLRSRRFVYIVVLFYVNYFVSTGLAR